MRIRIITVYTEFAFNKSPVCFADLHNMVMCIEKCPAEYIGSTKSPPLTSTFLCTSAIFLYWYGRRRPCAHESSLQMGGGRNVKQNREYNFHELYPIWTDANSSKTERNSQQLSSHHWRAHLLRYRMASYRPLLFIRHFDHFLSKLSRRFRFYM